MTGQNIVSSEDMYIYWCKNATWKSGDPSSDKHIPFNPMVEKQGIKLPEAIYKLVHVVSDLYPIIDVDQRLEPSTVTFRMYYRDPILLAAMFTYKGLPTAWSGTADVMTFNFSNRDDETPNIAVQLHLEDKSGGGNHVNLLLDGGKITGYRWIIEEGEAMIEEVDIKFAEVSENTQAVDMDAGLDDGSFDDATAGTDGGWSLWDGQLCDDKKKAVHASSCTLTVGGAAVPGLHVQRARLEIDVPKAMKFVASSKTAGIAYDEKRVPYKGIFEGVLKGNNDISEAIAHLSSKTTGTVKFQYATNKYLQFTNGVLKNINDLSIPGAGESMDVSYEYEGAGSSVLTFSWTGNEATDPSNYIDHTDV